MTRGFRGKYRGDLQLCKLSDSALRAGELREGAVIRKACDAHLADLRREHGRLMKRRQRAARKAVAS